MPCAATLPRRPRRLRMHPRLRGVPAVMVSADATPASITAARAEAAERPWSGLGLPQLLRPSALMHALSRA